VFLFGKSGLISVSTDVLELVPPSLEVIDGVLYAGAQIK